MMVINKFTGHFMTREKIFRLFSEVILLPVTIFLIIFHSIVIRLNEKKAYAFGRRIIVPLFRTRRKRIVENMINFFGTETTRNVDQTSNILLNHISDTIVELIRSPSYAEGMLKTKVDVAGLEHLQTALRNGKGVLCIGNHIGNWWYTRALFSELGFPIANVSNRIPVRVIEYHLNAIRRRFHIRTTYVGEGGKKAAEEAFRHNEVFSIQFDISVPGRQPHSAWMTFGNAMMLVDTGPAMLAIRNRVPIILCTTYRTDEHRHRIILEPFTPNHPPSPTEQDAVALTQEWINLLVNDIREYPDQWWQWATTELRATKIISPEHR